MTTSDSSSKQISKRSRDPHSSSSSSSSYKKLAEKQQKLQDTFEKISKIYDAEPGFIKCDDPNEKTHQISQLDICSQIGLSSASKYFSLNLDYGPYSLNYSPNGRHLLMAGQRGHVATFDWKNGKIGCEFYLQDRVNDVHWLHNESLFAVAQQKYVYIYDNTGLEVHQLKKHLEVSRMEFLNFHFLLATVGKSGFLRYHDTSTGELVAELRTKLGPCSVMAQNQQNAIVHLGHSKGTVTMWAPKVQEPLVKMLCHRGPISGIAINRTGQYMATTGLDGMVKVWDLRNNYQPVHHYRTARPARCISFSQRDLLAIGSGPHLTVWKDLHLSSVQSTPYLYHLIEGAQIDDLQFCPFEDSVAAGTTKGITSLIIPGAGDPNIDSLHFNPFQTKKQRQEAEVKSLLEKLQPEMISLDHSYFGRVKPTENKSE